MLATAPGLPVPVLISRRDAIFLAGLTLPQLRISSWMGLGLQYSGLATGDALITATPQRSVQGGVGTEGEPAAVRQAFTVSTPSLLEDSGAPPAGGGGRAHGGRVRRRLGAHSFRCVVLSRITCYCLHAAVSLNCCRLLLFFIEKNCEII